VFSVRYELDLYIVLSVFRMVLTTNSDYFPKQQETVGLCNGNAVLL
jgi:hypothetical protein